MEYLYILIFFSIVDKCHQSFVNKSDTFTSLKSNSSSEQKIWNIKLDIYFAKSLPPVVRKAVSSDVRLKCEAMMNFTKVVHYTKNKEGIETSLKEFPPEHIQQTLMKNAKLYWLKDTKVLHETDQIKISTKVDNVNGSIGTYLKIKNLNIDDEANYTCVIKQTYEKKMTTRLIVEKSKADLLAHVTSMPNGDNSIAINIKATTNFLPESITIDDKAITTEQKEEKISPMKLEPLCQEYTGVVCSSFLSGQFVYIPYETTQVAQEDKLKKALQVTRYSNDISSHCENYALPSLCYSTFPICRHHMETNDFFLTRARKILNNTSDITEDIENPDKNVSMQVFNYRYNSSVLRRVCKKDCEILENELCQTEYAIAKRHPHIGQQLTLEECPTLPENDPDCLKIGIGTIMVSDDDCYWENGSGYLGRVNVTGDGSPCIEWSKQMYVKLAEHPELAGQHSYCRNPGGIKSEPWCMVDNDGKIAKLCDIPKCAHKIWIYIVAIFLILTCSIIGFIVCLFYRHQNKRNAANIRDINLPNADKNIYGNSRLNSPIEMNELLSNQNNENQPHLQTQSTRGNGILRIPQYSLSQIKFLEELGEGAFGKVYKGALKKNGETQYVAVKALKENASAKTKADFRREIDLISELNHENIVCIVGVALREEPLCMLFEFMARGDLHEFLMGRAPPSGKGLPAMRLLSIACNIAAGMQYLASHHYVHRDLAARNCLVSDDFVVKISDFGLSRDIYSSDYYRVQSKSLLPVRWMPPESILYGKFTTESDIWSYGVVLWEIYSYGLQPYYGYSNQEVIAMVRAGELLAAPAACPPPMYALMRDCWRHVPQRRPNFEEIVHRLQDWIQLGGCPEVAAPVSEAGSCGRRRDERAPLLPPHASNGSLAASLKLARDDASSTCSDLPPLAPKTKKHSSGSLIDTDKVGKDTVVRIANNFGNDI